MSMRFIASAPLRGGLVATCLFLSLVLLSLGTDAAVGATVPCAEVPAAISKATGPERAGLVISAIEHKCRPLPAVVVTALRDGKWEDGLALSAAERTILLAQATEAKYSEAETLAVSLIESGVWPDEQPLATESGVQLIRALTGVLTPYRVHLLLDVFEQVQEVGVRQAVVLSLRGSRLDEALLPALEAAYEAAGTLQEAGTASIAAQPEKTPPQLHARLIRSLPEGPLLNWALGLADRHDSDAVKAAKKARGLVK